MPFLCRIDTGLISSHELGFQRKQIFSSLVIFQIFRFISLSFLICISDFRFTPQSAATREDVYQRVVLAFSGKVTKFTSGIFFSSYGRCLSDFLMYIVWIFLLVARTVPHSNMRWIVYQVCRLQPTAFYGYASPLCIWVLKWGEGFEPRQTVWVGSKRIFFNSLWLVETLNVFICCDRRAFIW